LIVVWVIWPRAVIIASVIIALRAIATATFRPVTSLRPVATLLMLLAVTIGPVALPAITTTLRPVASLRSLSIRLVTTLLAVAFRPLACLLPIGAATTLITVTALIFILVVLVAAIIKAGKAILPYYVFVIKHFYRNCFYFNYLAQIFRDHAFFIAAVSLLLFL
jgi:hypothetical protein